jgi:alkylated DNA repair dioxygenase AlkB
MNRKILLETPRSKLWCIEKFSKDYFDELSKLKLNVKPEIKIMGRICHQRRNVAFYSDESIGYKYSGQISKSLPLNSSHILPTLLSLVNESLESDFNGILVNQYVDGHDYISAHSDDESSLSTNNKMVASIAYGTVRKFRIRDKQTKKILLDYKHLPGTLLVMEGDFQSEFTHEIPKETRVLHSRNSTTFRNHTE